MFFTLTDRASTIYVVTSPVRGLLDRKISEEHLRSSNESTKTKTKRQKERNNNTKHMPEKYGRWHSIERVWYSASREPSDTPPNRNHAYKRKASTTPYSQGFRYIYQHSRRRLGSPWVGPINAALNPLKLATVTPVATPTLSVSPASLFLCRCSDAFPLPSPTRP